MRALDRAVQEKIAEREEEVATRPVPRRPWERRTWEDEMEYGPIYAPADWWGDGEPIPEYARVRYLRALHRLEAAGLVEIATVAGRLRHVRLTAAGRASHDGIPYPAGTLPANRESGVDHATECGVTVEVKSFAT